MKTTNEHKLKNKIPLLIPDMPTTEELIPWLQRIDQSHWYSNFGPLNELFQQELLKHFDNNAHITTVSSCTAGLTLALQALELPPGSSILIPGFTFIATANAIIAAGHKPIFADIDPQSWLLTPEIAQQALTSQQFAAVMPVTALNHPQDVNAWDQFIETTNIPVIIDAAGAFGSQPNGKRATLVFSLHTTKAMGVGEGGFIIHSSPAFIEKIRIMSNFGLGELPHPRTIKHIGINAKLSEYHAAVGLANLQRWPQQQQLRRELLACYREHFADFDDKISWQANNDDFIHSNLAIRIHDCVDIANIAAQLDQQGIATLRWYYPPVFDHPPFSHYPQINKLSNTKQLAQELIGLPFHTVLTPDNIAYICQAVKTTLHQCVNS